jgi:hypothetical protein
LAKPLHVRDLRIDMFRGIALVMIFINHVPDTLWENYTSRNYGFSDAAEGFVLMSGMATGLAYGPIFLKGRPSLAEALRPWRRVVTLWWVQALVVLSALLLFTVTRHYPAVAAMADDYNIMPVLNDLPRMLVPLALLTHQFAYADILPLYIVLLLSAPAILALAVRWPRLLMIASLGLWFVVGYWKITVPTWPTPNGWFFNPLAWQVLFVAGVLTGVAVRKGQRWLPFSYLALLLAIAFLIGAAIWMQVPSVAVTGGHALWLLHEYTGLPDVFVAFNKNYVFFPRILHILALAYVVSALPAMRTLAASRWVSPLVSMGQNSLPVFASGSVLAYIAQVIKAISPASTLLDGVLVFGGLGILILVARLRDAQKRDLAYMRNWAARV